MNLLNPMRESDMRTTLLIVLLLLCPVACAGTIDLWEPVGGGYRYEIGDEVHEGEYPLVYLREEPYLRSHYLLETAGVYDRFSFSESPSIGYITSTFKTQSVGSFTGWIDFYSPEGKWFDTSNHPTLGRGIDTYYLDGELLGSDPVRVTTGMHRMEYRFNGAGSVGINLRVTPVPEPTNWLIAVGTGVLLWLLLGTRTRKG